MSVSSWDDSNDVSARYVYGSEVASLRTSDDEIVSEGRCLSISDAIGRRLRDGDKIRYKVIIIRIIICITTNNQPTTYVLFSA